MKRLTALFPVFLAFFAMAASEPALAQKQDLRGAGSTFAAAAYTSWGFIYAKEKTTTVVYKATGSGDGIRQILARDVDFGASDYALSQEELNRSGLLQFPTLVGAVVPVFNLPGVKSGQLRLTGPVLAAIFAGRITHWSDRDIVALNPGVPLPDMSIKRIVRSDDSGTTAVFTEYLGRADGAWAGSASSGMRVKWPKGVEGVKGNEGMASAVLSTVGSIGYASANQVFRSKLAYAQLQNKARKFVAPMDENINAAAKSATHGERLDLIDTNAPNAWPIVDATYILIERSPRNPERAREVLRFFYWAFLRGDAMASESGYVPLPATVQARVVASFREIRDPQGNQLDYMNSFLPRVAPLASRAASSNVF